jgi:pimeloyl-ACP methyl ester carboxylesterase
MITERAARIIAAIAAPLFLLHAAPGHCRPAPAAVASAATQLDHISIVKMGKGSPVILIPGLSSPRTVWDGIAPEIARTHSVYLVQLNGFGGDDPRANVNPGMIDGVIADLDGYIAKNKLAGAAVVGHSLGGLIGLDLAKTHPNDVGKLMVVDSLPYVGDIFLPGVTVAQVEPQAKIMRDKEIASYGKPADDAAATATANGLALKPDSRTKVIAWFKQADPRVTGEALYEDMTIDLRPDMASIQTPITLVYPWSDALPQEKADAFYHAEYAKAPRVTFVPVADSAHFVMLDQPAAFQAAMDAFLAK